MNRILFVVLQEIENVCKFHLLPYHLGSNVSTEVHSSSTNLSSHTSPVVGTKTSIDYGSLSAQSFADLNPTAATL